MQNATEENTPADMQGLWTQKEKTIHISIHENRR